jgi:hypothetical protein
VCALGNFFYREQKFELLRPVGVRHGVFLGDVVCTAGLISPLRGLPGRSPKFSRQINWLTDGA